MTNQPDRAELEGTIARREEKRDELPTTWKKMLGGYPTSREAIDQARKLGWDGRRKHLEYQVNLDRESGRYYIEYRRKAS